MITDKICYIHLRNQAPNGQYAINGGATIAWLVEGVSGDIIIGQPARCMMEDKFSKKEGRKVATDKLHFEKALFVIPRGVLVDIASAQGTPALQFLELTPDARQLLVDTMNQALTDALEATMSSSWYEQIVRAHFKLHANNYLSFNPKAAVQVLIEHVNQQLG